MSDLEERLRSWFAAEVDRAERDLATSRVTMGRSGRTPLAGLAVVGLVVAMVVVVVALRPNVTPDPGLGPDASPRRSPAIAGNMVFGPDGMPTLIDREPVLRVDEAAGRLLGSRKSLLVAGWYASSTQRCRAAATRIHPLIPECGSDWLRPTRDPEPNAGLQVVPPANRPENMQVVLRLHDHDPRAATCPAPQRARCEAAIVVEDFVWQNPSSLNPMAGRYLDGIPGDIAGETVLRPKDIAATPFPNDQRFLLGGWHGQDRWWGCGRLGETHPLLDDCSPEWIADTPGGPGPILMLARELPQGPVVIRVHTDDPRSTTCPEAERIKCAERLVVDELVWAGDDVTNTEPLHIDDVVVTLRQDIPGFTVEVAQIDRRSCDPGWPEITWVAPSATGAGTVLVFPTVAEREAVDQNFQPTGWTGLDGCIVRAEDAGSWHWVSVDNVMVSTSDALADRIQARLDAIAP